MVSIGVSPLFHIAGTGWNLMVMSFGGTVVLHREVDGEAILRDIGRYRVTHAILVPAILQLILARRNEGTADPSSLETVVYGASPISDRVLLELFDAFDCKFVQGYGLTETSGAVTTLRRRGPRPRHDPNCCAPAVSRWTESSCASSIPRPASSATSVASARCGSARDQVMTGLLAATRRRPPRPSTTTGWFRYRRRRLHRATVASTCTTASRT